MALAIPVSSSIEMKTSDTSIQAQTFAACVTRARKESAREGSQQFFPATGPKGHFSIDFVRRHILITLI
jgi:hypothetical protein